MNIESCNTWQCINSFAPWVSAFGTILISGVSLWLAIKDKLIRLKATFVISQFAIDDPRIEESWAYCISFVNIGVKPITITGYEWHFRSSPCGEKKRKFINPYWNTSFKNVSTKLPCELTDGKQGQIFHSINIFRDLENKSDFLFADSAILAFYRISTFNIFLTTSIGTKIKVKIGKGIRGDIWKQYRGKSSFS